MCASVQRGRPMPANISLTKEVDYSKRRDVGVGFMNVALCRTSMEFARVLNGHGTEAQTSRKSLEFYLYML